MDKSVLIKPFDKNVSAKTNMLNITDNQEQLITKLIVKMVMLVQLIFHEN